MTPNARIVLNILATYGRSLYALVLGLFTARWALQALGQVDYGLMGVVGGLAAFISFLNNLMAVAVGRFYAVHVGKESVAADKAAALEDTRRWFSVAVVLHTVLPSLLMLAGYPAGIWVVRHFLEIPPDRLADCVWVFRFVCASTFVTMVCVPVQAMYMAKQFIAELTLYSFATTTLNAIFLYYMVTHPGVWLAQYAFWTCLLAVAPQALIAARGLCIFPECRFRLARGGLGRRIAELGRFAGWLVFGMLGGLFRGQGIQLLLNKYFGPRVNSAMTVANHVTGHTQTLSMALVGAFQPAIVTAYGAGDLGRMRGLAYRACKFSLLFVLVFVLPLCLELEEILRLWLVDPPPYTHGLCLFMFAITAIDQSSVGHMMAVNARGKIAVYQAFLGGTLLMALPLAWLFLWLDWGVYSVGVALALTTVVSAWGRVGFARGLVGMSARYWFVRTILPALGVAAASLAAGCLPRLWMPPSLLRMAATAVACEIPFLSLTWLLMLDGTEKRYALDKARAFFRRAADGWKAPGPGASDGRRGTAEPPSGDRNG